MSQALKPDVHTEDNWPALIPEGSCLVAGWDQADSAWSVGVTTRKSASWIGAVVLATNLDTSIVAESLRDEIKADTETVLSAIQIARGGGDPSKEIDQILDRCRLVLSADDWLAPYGVHELVSDIYRAGGDLDAAAAEIVESAAESAQVLLDRDDVMAVLTEMVTDDLSYFLRLLIDKASE